jgi:hypothetical protein
MSCRAGKDSLACVRLDEGAAEGRGDGLTDALSNNTMQRSALVVPEFFIAPFGVSLLLSVILICGA